MTKTFEENWLGGKIYKLANGWFQWSLRGHEISARNKGALKQKIGGYLRSYYIKK